jgi:translocation protein SEC62
MSTDIKKRKAKKQQQQQNDEENKKMTKDEEAVAKFLKFNCQTRKANLMGMKVDYFIGSKAVDCLMSSKWATGDKNTPVLFPGRDSCRKFLQDLLNKDLYHRAAKVFKDQAEVVDKSSKTETTPENTPKPRKRKSEKAASEEKVNESDKSKRKFKLEMHDDQVFLDSNDPYVWIYDPATAKSIIVGSLLVIGAIGVCLFPLWPSVVRDGVYYLSVAGAGFLGTVLSLAVFKYILFALIWIATFGNMHFWLLPNLTEDVGFFESFKPLYRLKNKSANDKNNKRIKDKEDKKENEEFNKLPLEDQLMKKFDENIEDEEGDEDEIVNNVNSEVDDGVDEDYDVIDSDRDLQNIEQTN